MDKNDGRILYLQEQANGIGGFSRDQTLQALLEGYHTSLSKNKTVWGKVRAKVRLLNLGHVSKAIATIGEASPSEGGRTEIRTGVSTSHTDDTI